MPDDSQKSDRTVPTYSRGTWSNQPIPVSGYGNDPTGDHEEALRAGGYRPFTTQNERAALKLTVWRWEGVGETASPQQPHPTSGARFLIDIEAGNGYETVAATDIVDLMDLLARWAPTVQTDIMKDWATISVLR